MNRLRQRNQGHKERKSNELRKEEKKYKDGLGWERRLASQSIPSLG